jgi:hypothetical protein
VTEQTDSLLRGFAADHEQLRDAVALLRSAASVLAAGVTPEAMDATRGAYTAVVERILPHERAEETQRYPALAVPLGGAEATAPMSRAHAEIERLTRRLGLLIQQLDDSRALGASSIDRGQIEDLLATLYGLHAVFTLHFTQEEESYFALAAHPASQATTGERVS